MSDVGRDVNGKIEHVHTEGIKGQLSAPPGVTQALLTARLGEELVATSLVSNLTNEVGAFTIRWRDFDIEKVAKAADAAPKANLEIASEAGRPLTWVVRPLTASELKRVLAPIASKRQPTTKQGASPRNAADADIRLVAGRGLFDKSHYEATSGRTFPTLLAAIADYVVSPPDRRTSPSLYVDEPWYRSRHDTGGVAALVHFIKEGAKSGFSPSPHFNLSWYCDTYGVTPDRAVLDYLENRQTRGPNPCFDPVAYRERHEDVRPLPDPYQHFIEYGSREDRGPLPNFDAQWYRRHYFAPGDNTEPLTHYLTEGGALGHLPVPNAMVAAEFGRHRLTALEPLDALRLLASWGLIDPSYYVDQSPELGLSVEQVIEHYHAEGDKAGLKPSHMFDPSWYRREYGIGTDANALIHYATIGEVEGHNPCPAFDTAWYAEHYDLDLSSICVLAEYLAPRAEGERAPSAYFDPGFYLDENPDVRGAGVSAFMHWHRWGIYEGRRGSKNFDPEYVWRRYLGNDRKHHPYDRFMDTGRRLGWNPSPAIEQANLFEEIRRNSRPGPHFEERGPALRMKSDVDIIAFYLPQFHAIPENDMWWGTGFTEWTNVARAVPRYEGHYQPRIPRDFGFYHLDDNRIFHKQIDLARSCGITGFCFYYYNFNGKRLLEQPLDRYVSDPTIDFPFCIMWANENWTRRWDGYHNDVLIEQTYRPEDAAALVDDLARYVVHPNYIKFGQRPFIGFYRPDVVPDSPTTLANIRELFRERHGIDPLLVMAQTFGITDPRPWGYDAAVEFPPHKIGSTLPSINASLAFYDHSFSGSVRSYEDAVNASLSEPMPEYPLFKTAFPQWDNEARKQGSGMAFHGSSPAIFERWVSGILNFARNTPTDFKPTVFINAWNEWAEGTYLEPDSHFGFAYSNAVARAVDGRPGALEKVVLVGHDAFNAGAQQLLLNIGTTLHREFGTEIEFVLLGDGPLVTRYEKIAPTCVLTNNASGLDAFRDHIARLKRLGFHSALTNTALTGHLVPHLKSHNYHVISLIHELPNVIHEYMAGHSYEQITRLSDDVVFPAAFVRDQNCDIFGLPSGRRHIRPQERYKPLEWTDAEIHEFRRELNITDSSHIILNVGHGDLRKGLDTFVRVAASLAKTRDDVVFVWLGSHNPSIKRWIDADIERLNINNVRFAPATANVGPAFGAASAFFLSSREDPYPSVVLEAAACKLPVVALRDTGGHCEFLASYDQGHIVDGNDPALIADAISSIVNSAPMGATPAPTVQFSDYCSSILSLAFPKRRRISVIVPNYNYGAYLRDRLSSIFSQTYPIFELIILDDASTDDSVVIAEQTCDLFGRAATIIESHSNSGNVFGQWERGVELARGDLVWIAEADDLADPHFLENLVAAFEISEDTTFAFCDSTAIDENNNVLYASYKDYYRSEGDDGLSMDLSLSTRDFAERFMLSRNVIMNVSSVLWDREMLHNVLNQCRGSLGSFKCAGDWYVYLTTLLSVGSVHYIARTLNKHRRHSHSVTSRLNKDAHIREIEAIHGFINDSFSPSKAIIAQQGSFISKLRVQWDR